MPINNPNIPVYSAADLLRYATGRMTASEMHTLEKAALEDPFLAEAIEGYLEAKAHPQLQTSIDRLTPATTKKEERKPVPLWQKKKYFSTQPLQPLSLVAVGLLTPYYNIRLKINTRWLP